MIFNNFDRDLLPIKAHYFFYNAATGPIVPFLPSIAQQLGFSNFLVGTMYTILPISGLIAKPLFGGLADKFKLHKSFFIGFQAILAIAFFTINFLPNVQNNTTKNTDVRLVCDKNVNMYIEIFLDKNYHDPAVDNFFSHSKEESQGNNYCTVLCPDSKNFSREFCGTKNTTKFCQNMSSKNNNEEEFEFEVLLSNNSTEKLDSKINPEITMKVLSIKLENEITKFLCNDKFQKICELSCPKVPWVHKLLKLIANSTEPNIQKATKIWTYQFYLFLWAAIISWIGMAVVVSIGDAICFDQLGDKRSKDYGKQKMWGCIGFGVFGISAGYLVDIFSKDEVIKNYSCIFYIMLIAMILDIAVSSKLKNKSLDNVSSEPSVLWELGSIAREGRVLVFAWWCIGAGMCTGVIWNFLFLYTEELSQQSKVEWLKTLQGLLIGVQSFFGEMPFNFISGTILRKIGHINAMSLVLLVYAIRFMMYSLIRNPWIIIPIEILHGPTLGLCWPTMVSYGDKVAPSGTKATIQGLVGAIFEGIGVSMGSLLCGYLMDEYKGVVTFRVFSVGALVWLSIFWILQILLQNAKAYPFNQGHIHLATYYPPDDALFMTTSQEMQTY